MSKILGILDELRAFSSLERVRNQYLEADCIGNVEHYLNYTESVDTRILLVAEAPGSKGCARTGIPFTTARNICEVDHRLFDVLKPRYEHSENTPTEPTATIMWNYIKSRFGSIEMPLIWNALPFHPHDEKGANRTPTLKELKLGTSILSKVVDCYQPEKIASIGWSGIRSLALLRNEYVPHPSYGQKESFTYALDELINKRPEF